MSIRQWDVTAANNGTAASGINWPEGMAPSLVNNSARQMMADVARFLRDLGAFSTTTGSANAYTLTTSVGVTSYEKPLILAFKANFSNTGAATLAVDGLAAKSLKRSNGSDVAAGEIASGGIYIVVYEATADAFLVVGLNPVDTSGFATKAGGAWAEEADVASGTTTNIAGAATYKVRITGTNAITSLGAGANRLRLVHFAGALTLTHNATSLILPGASNITTAAGDSMLVWFDASSNARVLVYQRADGRHLKAFTGDSGSGGAIGLVPAPASGDATAGKFLKADGTWAVPAYPSVREKLSADRTYYVRTDGSDSNDGLTNSSGGAFLTIQRALDVCETIDFNGFAVTIRVAAGTYSANTNVPPMVGQGGVGDLVIEGDTSTPTNVILTHNTGYSGCIGVSGSCAIKGFAVAPTHANAHGFIVSGSAEFSNIVFNNASGIESHICVRSGGQAGIATDYTIAGNANTHWNLESFGILSAFTKTITASGSRAFTQFAFAQQGGSIVSNGCTFSGTFTGKRYSAVLCGTIQTYGSGANYLPGNATGTTATGGQYA